MREHGVPGKVRTSLYGEQGRGIKALQFRVEEVAVIIRSIEFQGATQLDPSLLQAVTKRLLDTDYEQSFVRDFVLDNVRALYQERGFLRASFGDPIVHRSNAIRARQRWP